MADDVVMAAWAGLRVALAADASLAALVPGDRVLDHVPENVAFPYIRLGRLQPSPDDTDGHRGHLITLGLECFSRPSFGRMQAVQICQAIEAALHQRPQDVPVAGFNLIEIEVQTWSVDRAADGMTWRGVVSLELRLDS